jgi:hypothetical protein
VTFCGQDHTHSQHRCTRTDGPCPKDGHLRAVAGCCSATPLYCTNCKGRHAAFDPTCPVKVAAEADLLKKLQSKAASGVRRTHRRNASDIPDAN